MENTRQFHTQRLGVTIAAAIGAVGCLLPWVSTPSGSAVGVEGWRGVMTLLAFIAAIVIACLPDRSRPLVEWQTWSVIGCAALAFLLCIVPVVDFLSSKADARRQLGNNPFADFANQLLNQVSLGLGIWIALLCSLALAAVVFALKTR